MFFLLIRKISFIDNSSVVRLQSQKLVLKSGKELALQAGMSLTANIKLRKVSWLQLLLGGFKDKTDSLKEV